MKEINKYPIYAESSKDNHKGFEICGLSKRYGATIALENVSFSVQPGEVCGLLGENGAGKSTLVKILSGVIKRDAGLLSFNGKPYSPKNCQDAIAYGVGTAYQELCLIPTLSVAINLVLPTPKSNIFGVVPSRMIEEEAVKILHEFNVDNIRPEMLVENLSLGEMQRLEIVRAMLSQPKLLLLDEPTAALSDSEWLFKLIDRNVSRGTSVIYITHKIDEVQRVCQHCIILRNGQKALDDRVENLSHSKVFSCMAGRSTVEAFPEFKTMRDESQSPVLRVSGLSSKELNNVSFSIWPGEVLGIAGLAGQGQSALFKSLIALSTVQSGQVFLNGKLQNITSPKKAREGGLILVPEDRKTEGLFPDLLTSVNISLLEIDQFTRLGIVQRGEENAVVQDNCSKVDLNHQYMPMRITSLSGGNQQKAILARALLTTPKCLLLFDPTSGVDVITKQTIYKIIRNFAEEGGAILFYSTQLDELVHLCDRCLVMYQNTIRAEVKREDLSQELLLSLAVGHELGDLPKYEIV